MKKPVVSERRLIEESEVRDDGDYDLCFCSGPCRCDEVSFGELLYMLPEGAVDYTRAWTHVEEAAIPNYAIFDRLLELADEDTTILRAVRAEHRAALVRVPVLR